MFLFFVFKQNTAYEMRISDWSSDVCSSDLTQFARSLEEFVDFAGRKPQVVRLDDECKAAATLNLQDGIGVVQAKGSAPSWTVGLDYQVSDRRSEERRVGKECVSTCGYGWSPDHYKKKKKKSQRYNTQ